MPPDRCPSVCCPLSATGDVLHTSGAPIALEESLLSQCHSALGAFVNYSRLSLVVCHAVGTLHCQTPILKLEIRIGALKIKIY